MSILGYSASYFLPQYWVNTPLYGEKIIPLLDYILSTDYSHTDQLATAFYNIESKYKNTSDLPLEEVEAIIDESGYGYIKDLLKQDENSIKILVYILVMLHQLKGSRKGLETVLNFLRVPENKMTAEIIGDLTRTEENEVYNFSDTSFVDYTNFNLGSNTFELLFQIKTGDNFNNVQCIASSPNFGFYLGIDLAGHLILKLGQQDSSIVGRSWQEIGGIEDFTSDRPLFANTMYYIAFEYTGYEYSLKVSTDGIKYSYYVTVNSNTPLNIIDSMLYLGVDHTGNDYISPFKGSMYLGPLTVSSNSTKVTQWFEKYPVGDENTFEIETSLDGELISTQFFENFAKFLSNYVYPTLEAFRATLTIRGKMTFIPYVRSRTTYIASDLEAFYQNFMSVIEDVPAEHEDYFVKSVHGNEEALRVRLEEE